MAMAEVLCGVKYISGERNGWPRCKIQRQGRNQQEGQGRQQRQPVGGLDRLHAEDALQRRQNECARHQPRDIGVQNDQHAPIERDFVGIHVSLQHRS